MRFETTSLKGILSTAMSLAQWEQWAPKWLLPPPSFAHSQLLQRHPPSSPSTSPEPGSPPSPPPHPASRAKQARPGSSPGSAASSRKRPRATSRNSSPASPKPETTSPSSTSSSFTGTSPTPIESSMSSKRFCFLSSFFFPPGKILKFPGRWTRNEVRNLLISGSSGVWFWASNHD